MVSALHRLDSHSLHPPGNHTIVQVQRSLLIFISVPYTWQIKTLLDTTNSFHGQKRGIRFNNRSIYPITCSEEPTDEQQNTITTTKQTRPIAGTAAPGFNESLLSQTYKPVKISKRHITKAKNTCRNHYPITFLVPLSPSSVMIWQFWNSSERSQDSLCQPQLFKAQSNLFHTVGCIITVMWLQFTFICCKDH